MSGFRKAKPEQVAFKVGFYGPPGSGKTFTTLLCAEGLAKVTGKRIAYVDTERGTDFYAQAVPERPIHPQAFDFDALYTRSIAETSEAIRNLDPEVYGVVVIDSITHIWEAAREAYTGKLTKVGGPPIYAWNAIKKPYKRLLTELLSSPMHVFLLGRQANEYDTDEDTDEMKKVGVKMKAEVETAYEPHILIRMELVRNSDGSVVTAFAEKDRTGILSGRTIANPGFNDLVKPILPLLTGTTQGKIESAEETGVRDSEAMDEKERQQIEESEQLTARMSARMALCENLHALKTLGKEMTPEFKKNLLKEHVAELRAKYLEIEGRLK